MSLFLQWTNLAFDLTLIIFCQVVWQRWHRSSLCLSFLIYEMGQVCHFSQGGCEVSLELIWITITLPGG